MAETFFWIVVFGGGGVIAAFVFLLFVEWWDRRNYIDRLREDNRREAELRRQGKRMHCDGWHIWWE